MRIKLKRMILSRGYSQKELSKKLCITPEYLSSIIHGKKNPSEYVVYRLAEELDMPIDDVLFMKDTA